MQKVTILCVGKLKEKFYIDAAAEYVKRLSRFCKLELVELPEERLPEDPSPAQIEAALLKEAAAIRAKLPSGAALIALCVEGEPRSSEALARQMENMKQMQLVTADAEFSVLISERLQLRRSRRKQRCARWI